MENRLTITDLLKDSNLLQYESALMEQGADDIHQLIELPENDFQDLLQLIGMDSKPFHVMRFKKTLGRLNKPDAPLCNTPSTNTHTVTVYATQIDDPLSRPLVAPPNPSPGSSANHILPQLQHKTLPSLIPVHSSSSINQLSSFPATSSPQQQQLHDNNYGLTATPEVLHSFVDDSFPVQKRLGPSPIAFGIWDEGRKEVIRNASQTFTVELLGREPSFYEQSINNASYQFCLWDPTLLVRKDELVGLAKKFVTSFSSSMTGESEVIGANGCDENRKSGRKGARSSVYPVNRGTDGKFKACFEKNYQVREGQIKELEARLSDNTTQQQVKQAQLVEAKQKKDYATALRLQEEISALGQSHRQIKAQMSQVKKIQRRSIRHQEMKRLKNNSSRSMDDVPNTSPTLMSYNSMPFVPTCTPPLLENHPAIAATSSTISIITPTSFVEQMNNSSSNHYISPDPEPQNM